MSGKQQRGQLPIVDETKNHSPNSTPNGITPTPTDYGRHNMYNNGVMHHMNNSVNSHSNSNGSSMNFSGSQNHLTNTYSNSQTNTNTNTNTNTTSKQTFSSYHHSTINPRNLKLTAPSSGHHLSGSDSSRTALMRSV